MALTPDTEELLNRARTGDATAVGQLFDRHRKKLRQMVAVRMDSRLTSRVDPSDVVQEAVVDASQKLEGYLRDPPVAFYPWLRQIAWQRLVDCHRRHILADRRSVCREDAACLELPDHSVLRLARQVVESATSPSGRFARKEMREQVRNALDELAPRDREVLVLLYLEQLSTCEAGTVLEISEKAVTMRHIRALDRLRPLLSEQ